MTLVVCVDDKGGMLFNKRRQSRDIRVCERMLQLAQNSRLVMNAYSATLFENMSVTVVEDLLARASDEDFVFVENVDLSGALGRFSKVVLFHWNRAYPSDLKFPTSELNAQFVLEQTEDFSGNSHDVITQEVYVR